MLKINIILLFSSVMFALCESSAIAKINKTCEPSDTECLKEAFQTLWIEIAEQGIPELDIPRSDPYEFKHLEFNVLGMVKILKKNGTVNGFKTCTCNNYKLNMETKVISVEMFCESVSIEGLYKLSSTPTLLGLTGGIDVRGEGAGSLSLEKLQVDANAPFDFKKKDDGQIYFDFKSDEVTFEFNILGKATVAADNILVGKQEISTVATNIFNENWKVLTKNFGTFIQTEAEEVAKDFVRKIADRMPANRVIMGDLSSYVS